VSQYDFGEIDPNTKSGGALAADLNQWRDAIHSLHRGAGPPSYIAPGMIWLKEVSGTLWELNLYTPVGDIKLGNINPSTGVWDLTVRGGTFAQVPVGPNADPETDNALTRRSFVVPRAGGVTMTGLFTLSGDPTAALHPATKQYADRLAPAGTVATFAMNTAPTGWLKANGAVVSRTTYATLFSAIGTTFGVGDGSTTFGVPDLRGEFIRGWDDGRGIDSGRSFGTSQLDQLQNIQGVIANMWGFAASGTSGALSGSVSGSSNQPATGGGGSIDIAFNAANSSGARTGAETRPRNIALLACIKF
jgi:microcystin-dependent protein